MLEVGPWVAGGIAWVCLLVGFVLGAGWNALAKANDEIDDAFNTGRRGQVPPKSPPYRHPFPPNRK